MAQMQERQVNVGRLLSVSLFLIFTLLSLFNVVYMGMQYHGVRRELIAAKGNQDHLMAQTDGLTQKITSMKDLKDKMIGDMGFVRQDLPTVEFLAALEGAVPSGVKITRLEIRTGNVMMEGVALDDQNIITLGAKLDGMKNIVKKVDAPTTTRTAVGNRVAFAFKITCDIRGISEIAASTAALAAETSEDVEAVPGGEAGPQGPVEGTAAQ